MLGRTFEGPTTATVFAFKDLIAASSESTPSASVVGGSCFCFDFVVSDAVGTKAEAALNSTTGEVVDARR